MGVKTNRRRVKLATVEDHNGIKYVLMVTKLVQRPQSRERVERYVSRADLKNKNLVLLTNKWWDGFSTTDMINVDVFINILHIGCRTF